jgi:hypothetical protein
VLQVDDVLDGFCGGWFGRDSYDDKRVEAIGVDWVVTRTDAGGLEFACDFGGHKIQELCEYKKLDYV